MTQHARYSRAHRMAFGLALATLVVVGVSAAPAWATSDGGTSGSRHAVAGSPSGQVDPVTGTPLSAGVVGAEGSAHVIPHSSHRRSIEASQSRPASEPFVAGVTDFPRSSAALPPEQPESGTRQWADGLTVAIAAVLAALGLGLGLGSFGRSRIAGL